MLSLFYVIEVIDILVVINYKKKIMRVYWKEDGKRIGQDNLGNPVYEKIIKHGELVGSAYRSGSGYPDLVIATPDGNFVSKESFLCTHIIPSNRPVHNV